MTRRNPTTHSLMTMPAAVCSRATNWQHLKIETRLRLRPHRLPPGCDRCHRTRRPQGRADARQALSI